MPQAIDILLVEDDTNIAVALTFILSRAGWRVRQHHDGEGANDLLRATRPRLVILDLMLPGLSGAEVLARLRADADADLASTRVLMLTARGQPENSAPGADAYLAKPFANDELRDLVGRLLGEQGAGGRDA
ncbi:MAG: response regulator [Paracoccus sp. (in: a-proteobacteria)]|uniref:response regulator transcription factor n=1 Tax=Paracoccus sp. TaxID=267 RepID=UPI0026DECDD2|nr:response regulator [Paracoccus sp. (in: a-proteobacteria)]MDO5612823.1 response regulator [Paracoccus sp. (in: a-proteobacteria)]